MEKFELILNNLELANNYTQNIEICVYRKCCHPNYNLWMCQLQHVSAKGLNNACNKFTTVAIVNNRAQGKKILCKVSSRKHLLFSRYHVGIQQTSQHPSNSQVSKTTGQVGLRQSFPPITFIVGYFITQQYIIFQQCFDQAFFFFLKVFKFFRIFCVTEKKTCN